MRIDVFIMEKHKDVLYSRKKRLINIFVLFVPFKELQN